MNWRAEIQGIRGTQLTVGDGTRLMRRFRSQTALACGLASTFAARMTTSTWSVAMRSFYGLEITESDLRGEALEWALARGARSGRVAFQYIQDLAGRLGVRLCQT